MRADLPVPRFADYEQEIYPRGSRGEVPALPMTTTEMEARARELMAPRAFGYVAGSAGLEQTAAANLEAFRRWSLLPRQLLGAAERDLSVELLGTKLPTRCESVNIGKSTVHSRHWLAALRGNAGSCFTATRRARPGLTVGSTGS